MKAISLFLFRVGNAKRFPQGSGQYPMFAGNIVRKLLFAWIALVILMPLPSGLWASDEMTKNPGDHLDERWLPWIGSWRLVSNTINTVVIPLNEEYLLTIRPDDDGKFITMESTRDQTVMFAESIAADGLRRTLDKDECTGWYLYSWSETGNRLLFDGESSCAGNLTQKISGISTIDTVGDFVDIKLLKSGDEKAITIRRYRSVDNDFEAPAPSILSKAFDARIRTGKGFSIEEIIELSGKVEQELLETALVEMNNPFPINSKQLIRLSKAKVPSRVVDLMVALSFPEKFTVKKSALSYVETSPGFTAPYYQWPMSPWYWTPSAYWFNGYHYYGWDWYLQYGWYPYHYEYTTPGSGSGVDGSGRLVSGQGYTIVNPESQRRYAQPRYGSATQITKNGAASSSSAGSSSSAAGNSVSSGSYTGSGYSAPSASPGGYSSGVGSAGAAQPR